MFCNSYFKVDGGWSAWTDWTSCSKSCGGGIATRIRRCDSPPTDPEGIQCQGNNSEKILCNEEKCPGKFLDSTR